MATKNQPNQSQIALERANKNLQASVASAQKAITDVQSLVTLSEDITLKIEDLTAEAAELQAKNEAARRTAAAELKLRVMEDREGVFAGLLKEFNNARITPEAVNAIQKELAEKNAKDDSEQKAAVAIALNAAKREADFNLAQVKSANDVAAAQKDATIQGQNDKIQFLTAQVAQLQAQVEADRNARIEIAKAESARQGVVVQTGKQ